MIQFNMRLSVHYVMDRKIKERLELALRPVEPPTLEEVLEQVSTRGVLRGPVDWVFPAWMLYVEYATQKIAETFQLSEEERRQLFHFRDTMKQLLLKAWIQAKEKLTTLYKAVVEGTYRVEGNRLYAPDGTWMYVRGSTSLVLRIPIHGVSALARFPDLLKLPQEKLELLQLGWRASDEGEKGGQPYMGTTQPWQVFAWAATRYGELYLRVDSTNLTREGVSVLIRIIARSWRQRWSKAEAIDLVASHLRRGEWAPLLTAWLGDGAAERKRISDGNYLLIIVTKEPWRPGISIGTRKALVATGKEAFVKLRDAAGVYGVLFDVLKAHKWIYIKLATDGNFRAAYVLSKAYKRNNDKNIKISHTEADKPGTVVVAGVVMHLDLLNSRGGTLIARRRIKNLERALATANKLKAAGLRPNIVKSGPSYVLYIATADLLKLAERNGTIRRAIALYLAEKAKSGTPRQREIAKKILKRHPLFSISQRPSTSLKTKSHRRSVVRRKRRQSKSQLPNMGRRYQGRQTHLHRGQLLRLRQRSNRIHRGGQTVLLRVKIL
jgi:hypothetical protein